MKVEIGYKVFADIEYELSINTLGGKIFYVAENSCNEDMSSTFDDSLYETAHRELEEKHGCKIPFLPQIKSKDSAEYLRICERAEIGRRALKSYEEVETKMLGYTPYTKMDISLGIPNFENDAANPQGSVPYHGYGSDNTSFVLFYFKPRIKVKRTVLEYDYLTLVAEIGGYVGLFIGISLAESSMAMISFFAKMIRRKLSENKLN